MVSPGTTNRLHDYRHKRTEYAARRILEYWIVDPQEQQITVCKWVDGAYEDRVFKGSGAERASRHHLESVVAQTFALTAEQIFGSIL